MFSICSIFLHIPIFTFHLYVLFHYFIVCDFVEEIMCFWYFFSSHWNDQWKIQTFWKSSIAGIPWLNSLLSKVSTDVCLLQFLLAMLNNSHIYKAILNLVQNVITYLSWEVKTGVMFLLTYSYFINSCHITGFHF